MTETAARGARTATTVGVVAMVTGVFTARAFFGTTWPLVVLFTALLAVGALWPIPADPAAARPGAGGVVAVLVVGAVTFLLGRLLGGERAPLPLTVPVVALNTLAAVAEEAFFRRLVFAVLRPGGVLVAGVGSAALFAVAHVPVYGWWVLPLDLAAGLVLAWQRWASGTWTVPAMTHAIANALMVL